ncbi:hypothetical protein DUI87_03208 [Hirundo rustica rustica]|uniref:ribonuclease H n=1 Tax=Hirundo rustica rustica TaxID=333673 RepID=A0A3M0LKL9_HIRRU|nr:hypothetical protein DUI87_03208 [Hirundo rustica rustica]
MLWNLATLGPSQYATYIATIHPDNNRETVGSVANKLRNYESIISGPVQAQVSAVAKELREEIREKMEENAGLSLLHLEGRAVHLEPTAQGWKHSPTICHGLIQAALEKGEAPEHLQYIDDIIVWGNTAMEVFEKGEKIIHILLKAGFAIKQSKVKGPAREIQFLE